MRYICLFIGVALVLCGLPLRADTMVIDFESLNSGDSVTTQFSGLAFSGATVLTAGISLDEFEFPPSSGSNVVFDDGGPLSISFQTPMLSFGGFFTYAAPLTLSAFDASNNLVASATSALSSNLGLSGEAGSQPNEFLQVSGTGIASISDYGRSLRGFVRAGRRHFHPGAHQRAGTLPSPPVAVGRAYCADCPMEMLLIGRL